MSEEKKNTRQRVTSVGNAWVVSKSKSHPGYVYYFNTLTGEAVWNLSEAEIEKNGRPITECEPGKSITWREPKDNPPANKEFNKMPSQNRLNQQQHSINNILQQQQQLFGQHPEASIIQTPQQSASVFQNMPVNDLSQFDLNALSNQMNAFNVLPPSVYAPNAWSMPRTQQIIITPTIPFVNQAQSNAPLKVPYNQLINNGEVNASRPEIKKTFLNNMPNRRFTPNRLFHQRNKINRGGQRNFHNVLDLRQQLHLKRRMNEIVNQRESSSFPEDVVMIEDERAPLVRNGRTADVSSYIADVIEEINSPKSDDIAGNNKQTDNNDCPVEKITLTLDLTSLKSLAPSTAEPDSLYIVVDLHVLLDEFILLNAMVESDENCHLVIPDSVMSELKDFIACSNNIPARKKFHLLSHLIDKGCAVVGEECSQNYSDTITNPVLITCLELYNKNCHVILVTQDNELLNFKKFITINILSVDEIKSRLDLNPLKYLSTTLVSASTNTPHTVKVIPPPSKTAVFAASAKKIVTNVTETSHNRCKVMPLRSKTPVVEDENSNSSNTLHKSCKVLPLRNETPVVEASTENTSLVESNPTANPIYKTNTKGATTTLPVKKTVDAAIQTDNVIITSSDTNTDAVDCPEKNYVVVPNNADINKESLNDQFVTNNLYINKESSNDLPVSNNSYINKESLHKLPAANNSDVSKESLNDPPVSKNSDVNKEYLNDPSISKDSDVNKESFIDPPVKNNIDFNKESLNDLPATNREPTKRREIKLKRFSSQPPQSTVKTNKKRSLKWRRNRNAAPISETDTNEKSGSANEEVVKAVFSKTDTADNNTEKQIEQISNNQNDAGRKSSESTESRESSIINTRLVDMSKNITIEETSTSGIISNTVSNDQIDTERKSNEFTESSESSINCVDMSKNITIEETSTSELISNTESNVDTDIEYNTSKQIQQKEMQGIQSKVISYDIENEVMEESLKTNCKEWVSRFVQIMVDVLSMVLRKEPIFSNIEFPPPWTLHEAAQCIRKYSKNTEVKRVSDKLSLIIFDLSDSAGKIYTNIAPCLFMELYSCGAALLQEIKAITSCCEDVEIAEESLRKLLDDIKNPAYRCSDAIIDTHSDSPNKDITSVGSESNTLKSPRNINSSYNLRPVTPKKLTQEPIKIVHYIDTKSSFLSNLNLMDVDDQVADEGQAIVSHEPQANEQDNLSLSRVQDEDKIDDSVCDKTLSKTNFVRNFSVCAEFEKKLKSKFDPSEVNDEDLDYEDDYNSAECNSDKFDMSVDDAVLSEPNDTRDTSEGADSIVDDRPETVDPSSSDSSNDTFKLMICVFLEEVGKAVKEVKSLCDTCYAELKRPQLPDLERKELIRQVENARFNIAGLCLSLDRMLSRDPNAPTDNMRTALKNAGINISELDRNLILEYWRTIANCKKLVDDFLNSIREILTAFKS